MTHSYPIKIWSGLLLNGHTQKIENALWEFIWLVNKVTKEEDGIGYVLRGTPIKVSDICTDLKRKYQSVYRHLQQLKKNGYINMKKAPYGLIITINNSKKFTNSSFIKNDKAGLIKNETRLIKYDNGLIKNDKANKDIKDNKDINIYTTRSSKELLTEGKMNFNFDTKEWENIIEEDMSMWKEAYPACEIKLCLSQMREWLIANPKKKKKNYRRFITNWLAKAQDRGGVTKNGKYKSSRNEQIFRT